MLLSAELVERSWAHADGQRLGGFKVFAALVGE
jgi:hypothetical protein